MGNHKKEVGSGPAPLAIIEVPLLNVDEDIFRVLPAGIALGTVHIEINGVPHHIVMKSATSEQLKVLYDHSTDFAKYITAPVGYIAPVSAAENQVLTGGCNGC